MCIPIADSHCCTAETSTTLQSNYTPIIDFKKGDTEREREREREREIERQRDTERDRDGETGKDTDRD